MYSCIGFKKSYPVDIYIYKKDVYTWSVHKVYTFYISEETLRWPPLFPRGRQHFIHTSYKEKKKKEKEKKKKVDASRNQTGTSCIHISSKCSTGPSVRDPSRADGRGGPGPVPVVLAQSKKKGFCQC